MFLGVEETYPIFIRESNVKSVIVIAHSLTKNEKSEKKKRIGTHKNSIAFCHIIYKKTTKDHNLSILKRQR